MRTITLHHEPVLEVRRRDAGGVAVIEASGAIDLFSAPLLKSELEAAVGERDAVVVDLTGVEFIDSTGVVTLVHARRAMGHEQGFAVVCAPGSAVARLLERIRAERMFAIHDRCAQAVAELH